MVITGDFVFSGILFPDFANGMYASNAGACSQTGAVQLSA
jgi:hypothetical protein